MSARCTSCGEPLRWARTPDGKSMPLNREPDPTGIIVLEDDGSLRVLSTEAASAARHAGRLTYTSHFAMCAHAAEHRRQRERWSRGR